LKDKGVDGRMGSKWTLGRLVGGYGVDLMWLRIRILAESFECGELPFAFWFHRGSFFLVSIFNSTQSH
jgi:hypothetical protein